MNWDAIGAIAETLGAVGVIASLVYLAGQMRQNTRAMRAGTSQDIFNKMSDIAMSPAGDAENLRAVSLGTTEFAKLEGEEKSRFGFWVGGVLMAYENAYYQYRVGLLDGDRWRLYHAQLRSALRTPGITQWWVSQEGTIFSPEFVALVEEILGEEPHRGE